MARHNREGRGEDQSGHEYIVSFQPDWFHQVKVARDLPSGRQSTKVLFRNPERPARAPGALVRTGVSAPQLGLEFQVELEDPRLVVQKITVEATIPDGPDKGETVVLSVARKRLLAVPAPKAG